MAVRGRALPASAGTAARRRRCSAAGCQIQRRPSSWLRSSSPAPRSLDRHLAPTIAPAIHGDTSGNRTSATFQALRPIAPASDERTGDRRRIQIPRRQSCSPAKQPCANSPSQTEQHRQAEVGNDRLRVQHHAARLPVRCHSVDASVEHASTASRWIVAISSMRIVPRSTLRPTCAPSARTRSAISSSPQT